MFVALAGVAPQEEIVALRIVVGQIASFLPSYCQ
jgi:hypothetical protein